jgi:nuclear pore complex protein Nup160
MCSNQYSLHFLLAQSYLTTGEIGKALDHFLKAAGGVSDSSEALLQQVVRNISGEGEEGEEDNDKQVQGERGERTLRYYLKVITLFEQVSCPIGVVSIAKTAVRHAAKDDPLSVVLWSTLFKYHLELGHFEEAYDAMMANPDPIRCDSASVHTTH